MRCIWTGIAVTMPRSSSPRRPACPRAWPFVRRVNTARNVVAAVTTGKKTVRTAPSTPSQRWRGLGGLPRLHRRSGRRGNLQRPRPLVLPAAAAAHGERAKLLEQLADLRDAVQDACHRIDPPFWNKFYLLVDRVRNGVAALAPDQPSRGLVVPAAKDSDPPATWAVFLWKAIQGTSPRPPARLVRLLSAAACGQYPEVSIAFADERRKAPERGDGPKPIPPVELTALGTLPLPDKPIVVFAGESAEDFSRATGRIIHGIGRPRPAGRARLASRRAYDRSGATQGRRGPDPRVCGPARRRDHRRPHAQEGVAGRP